MVVVVVVVSPPARTPSRAHSFFIVFIFALVSSAFFSLCLLLVWSRLAALNAARLPFRQRLRGLVPALADVLP